VYSIVLNAPSVWCRVLLVYTIVLNAISFVAVPPNGPPLLAGREVLQLSSCKHCGCAELGLCVLINLYRKLA
jgi:hypothetical protein